MGENIFFVLFLEERPIVSATVWKSHFYLYTWLSLFSAFTEWERPYKHFCYLSSLSVVDVVGWRVSKALWPKESQEIRLQWWSWRYFLRNIKINCKRLQNFKKPSCQRHRNISSLYCLPISTLSLVPCLAKFASLHTTLLCSCMLPWLSPLCYLCSWLLLCSSTGKSTMYLITCICSSLIFLNKLSFLLLYYLLLFVG